MILAPSKAYEVFLRAMRPALEAAWEGRRVELKFYPGGGVSVSWEPEPPAEAQADDLERIR